MNTFSLLTYHAWLRPRRTFHQLAEQIDLYTAILLYAVITLLFVAVNPFIYTEQSRFDIPLSLTFSLISPLALSELAYYFTKQRRANLLHGVLLIYTSTNLLYAPAHFLSALQLAPPASFVISALGAVLLTWSLVVQVLMVSELMKRGKRVAFFVSLVSILVIAFGWLALESALGVDSSP